MKTLLVSARDTPPRELRDLVRRGSTSLDEISAGELSTFVSREGLGVDRIVFWAGAGDADVRSLAVNYATVAGAEGGQPVVYVTGQAGEAPVAGLGAHDIFVWPRDADKLRVIFMTTG